MKFKNASQGQGDSLLIHGIYIQAHTLFIGLCSASSNMTGYSHSYHSIKLIHCSAPQRDVLSDKIESLRFHNVDGNANGKICASVLQLKSLQQKPTINNSLVNL